MSPEELLEQQTRLLNESVDSINKLRLCVKDFREALDYERELSGLDSPTEFALSQAKGRAISRALEVLAKHKGVCE